MKLRHKVPLIIIICFGVLLIALSQVFNSFVFKDYQSVEKKFIDRDIQRIQAVLEVTEKSLLRNAEGFSYWDDTYNYMKGSNPKYRATSLNYDALGTFEIDHMFLIDKQGAIKDAILVVQSRKTTTPASDQAIKAILESSIFTKTLSTGESHTGLVSLDGKAYIYAVVPIQDNNATASPMGNMIITSEINRRFSQELSRQTKLDIRLHAVNDEFKRSDLGSIFKYLNEDQFSNTYYDLETDNGNKSYAYSIINDFKNSPVVMVELISDREIYFEGLSTKRIVITTVSIIGIVTLLLIVSFLEISLLSRLRKLSDQIKKLASSHNKEDEIKMAGNDELSFLAADVNSMFHSLDDSRKEIILAKEQAEQANNAKTRFLAAVSHELRTPIHGIFGLIRMCFKDEKSPTKLSLLQMMYNTTQGLSETINDLLDISKNNAGKLSLDYKKFKTREVVKDVLSAIAPRANEKPGVELICSISPDVPEVIKSDPLRLKQIMMNLVGNAIKFTTNGTIHLSISGRQVSQDKRPSAASANELYDLIIVCKDSGIGIPEDQLGSLLKPFGKGGALKAGNSMGTGLGLTVVNEIAESLGGKLAIESKLNEGSEFKIEIPVEIIVEQKPFLETEKFITCITDNLSFIETLNVGVKPLKVSIIPAQKSSLGTFRGAKILIDGKLLSDESFWIKMRESTEFHNNKLIVILSPLQLVHKDRLDLLKVYSVLIKPFLPEDLLELIKGKQPANDLRALETDIISSSKVDGLQNLKILVADDVKTNQIILANLLEEAGHKVTVVDDGQELVDMLDEHDDFDVVLTDIQMPRIDGLAATKIIRDREKLSGSGKKIPIVAVTAHAFPDEHKMMMDVGLSAIITKPIDPAKLRELFKELFDERLKQRNAPAKPQAADKETNIPSKSSFQFNNWEDDSKSDFRTKPPVASPELIKPSEEVIQSNPLQEREGPLVLPEINDKKENKPSAKQAPVEEKEDRQLFEEQRPVIPAFEASDSPLIINNETLSIDKTGLLMRAGGKNSVASAILESFIQSCPELANDLDSAMGDRNVAEIRRIAHALKGILLDIGCKSIASLAQWLEHHPQGADWNTVSATGEAIIIKCDDLIVLAKKLKREFDPKAPSAASP